MRRMDSIYATIKMMKDSLSINSNSENSSILPTNNIMEFLPENTEPNLVTPVQDFHNINSEEKCTVNKVEMNSSNDSIFINSSDALNECMITSSSDFSRKCSEENLPNLSVTCMNLNYRIPWKQERFFKGCKWSVDEKKNEILTCDGYNTLKVFKCFTNEVLNSQSIELDLSYQLLNIGKIYDYGWYPCTSSCGTFVLTATSLGPLHIWNLLTSKNEASYRMYNSKDEAIHANSVCCSPDGSKIYGGTSDYIFLFDANRPGRTYQQVNTRPHFRKGIISTIAVNPIRYSMFAVGSYNNRIGIYDENQPLCILYGHSKGITHLQFTSDGVLLYSGVRGGSEIICWDLRNPGTALYKLERIVKTQQKIYFDISHDDRFLISGCTNGDVYIWDTKEPPSDNLLLPIYKFKAHSDCTNGVSFNKKEALICTVSGQYHHNSLIKYLKDDDDYIEDDFTFEEEENSLKLWKINNI